MFSRLDNNKKINKHTVILKFSICIQTTKHYCGCKQGLRTCPCAHIVAVLIYLNKTNLSKNKILLSSKYSKMEPLINCNIYKSAKKRKFLCMNNQENWKLQSKKYCICQK